MSRYPDTRQSGNVMIDTERHNAHCGECDSRGIKQLFSRREKTIYINRTRLPLSELKFTARKGWIVPCQFCEGEI